MAIDRDTLILVTVLGGPFGGFSYVAHKVATYLGPRVQTKELLPTLPGQQGKLFLPRFTAKPELVRGLWNEIKIVEKKEVIQDGEGAS